MTTIDKYEGEILEYTCHVFGIKKPIMLNRRLAFISMLIPSGPINDDIFKRCDFCHNTGYEIGKSRCCFYCPKGKNKLKRLQNRRKFYEYFGKIFRNSKG
jgi:hypothetical protein